MKLKSITKSKMTLDYVSYGQIFKVVKVSIRVMIVLNLLIIYKLQWELYLENITNLTNKFNNSDSSPVSNTELHLCFGSLLTSKLILTVKLATTAFQLN